MTQSVRTRPLGIVPDIRVGIVPESQRLNNSELKALTVALTRQLSAFGQAWEVNAKVFVLAPVERAIDDVWPLFVVDSEGSSAHSFGSMAKRPFAEVQYGPEWTVDVSHELLEMLADPYITAVSRRTIRHPSPVAGQGEVDFWIEPCDPVDKMSYKIDGVSVSNFCTPRYYDLNANSGPFDQMGAVGAPLEITGGDQRVEWCVPTTPQEHWHRYYDRIFRRVRTAPVDPASPLPRAASTHYHATGADST
jgi:hypothetical protein